MYIYTTTKVIPSDLLVPDTSNCYIYPLIPNVNSTKPLQILHLPSCHLRANSFNT